MTARPITSAPPAAAGSSREIPRPTRGKSRDADQERVRGSGAGRAGMGVLRRHPAGGALPAGRRMVVHAHGSEEKGRGQASMAVTATLARAGRGTRVAVAQDLQLAGAAAQYGRGMISDVSSVLMRDFARNLQNRIDAADRGESPEQALPAAGSASGLTLGL